MIGHWLYHWLFLDAWIPLWPNLAASVVVAAWIGFRLHVLRRLHNELRELHLSHHREHMEVLGQLTGTVTSDTLEQEVE